jgi:hypothetical protein
VWKVIGARLSPSILTIERSQESVENRDDFALSLAPIKDYLGTSG